MYLNPDVYQTILFNILQYNNTSKYTLATVMRLQRMCPELSVTIEEDR
jgi:hypothetical protein